MQSETGRGGTGRGFVLRGWVMPADLRLAILLARPVLTPSDRQEAQSILCGPLDWPRFLNLTDWHGVSPLVADHLVGDLRRFVPPHVVTVLTSRSALVMGINVRLARALLELREGFQAHKIGFLSYKGPALAQKLYGSIALRGSNDLDLLVHRQDIGEARKCLAALGFHDAYGLSPNQQRVLQKCGFEQVFTRPDSVAVDLHWSLAQNFVAPGLDVDLLWQEAEEIELLGAKVPSMSAEQSLFALALHAAQHDWMQISHFCDLSTAIVSCPSLQWDVIEKQVRESRSGNACLVSLAITNMFWDIDLPQWVSAKIGNENIAQIARAVVTRFWTEEHIPVPDHVSLRWLAFRTRGEFLPARARFVGGVMLAPTVADFTAADIPASLSFLYAPLRVIRILARTLKGLLPRTLRRRV